MLVREKVMNGDRAGCYGTMRKRKKGGGRETDRKREFFSTKYDDEEDEGRG